MPYFIFAIYILVACFILYHSPLLRRSGLSIRAWIAFFIVKTCVGCFYGYWYENPTRIAGSDTWRFHFQGLEEYRLLLNDPGDYLSGLFRTGHSSWGGLLSTDSYWNDLKDILMIRIVSLMHAMSGGHYYVNVVIFSFLTVFGFVFFYGACRNVLQSAPGPLTTLIIFFTPSCLFWTSGLHRDGLMLLFTGMFLWRLTCLKRRTMSSWRDAVWLVLSFGGIFITRNYVAILLLPPVLAWAISVRYRVRPVITFPATVLVCVSLAFLISKPNLPGKLIERKAAFEMLSGRSELPAMKLQPVAGSFIRNLPLAVDRSLLRPYLWQASNALEKLAAIETMLIGVVLLAVLWSRRKQRARDISRFQWMMVVFCLAIFMLIGFTISFTGAIVRYRAMFIMFFAAAVSFHAPITHINLFNLLNNELKSRKDKTE